MLWCNVDEAWIAWIRSRNLFIISVFVPYLTMGRKGFLRWSGICPQCYCIHLSHGALCYEGAVTMIVLLVTQISFPVTGALSLMREAKLGIWSYPSLHFTHISSKTTSSSLEWLYLVLLRYKEKTNQPWLTLFLGPCLDRGGLNKTSVRRKGCGLWWLILSHKHKSVRVVPHPMHQTLLSLSRAGSPHPSPEEAGHPLLTLPLGDSRFWVSSNPTEKNPKHITWSSST